MHLMALVKSTLQGLPGHRVLYNQIDQCLVLKRVLNKEQKKNLSTSVLAEDPNIVWTISSVLLLDTGQRGSKGIIVLMKTPVQNLHT